MKTGYRYSGGAVAGVCKRALVDILSEFVHISVHTSACVSTEIVSISQTHHVSNKSVILYPAVITIGFIYDIPLLLLLLLLVLLRLYI